MIDPLILFGGNGYSFGLIETAIYRRGIHRYIPVDIGDLVFLRAPHLLP